MSLAVVRSRAPAAGRAPEVSHPFDEKPKWVEDVTDRRTRHRTVGRPLVRQANDPRPIQRIADRPVEEMHGKALSRICEYPIMLSDGR